VLVLLSACDRADRRPYYSAFRDCLQDHGVSSALADRASIESATSQCVQALGPMPTADTPFSQVEVSRREGVQSTHVFLGVLEVCLRNEGYPVDVVRDGGVWEIASGSAIPQSVLERCASSAQEVELRFLTSGKSA
jgi:hypothetical protein